MNVSELLPFLPGILFATGSALIAWRISRTGSFASTPTINSVGQTVEPTIPDEKAIGTGSIPKPLGPTVKISVVSGGELEAVIHSFEQERGSDESKELDVSKRKFALSDFVVKTNAGNRPGLWRDSEVEDEIKGRLPN